jgi:hypothetical protein
MTGRIMMRRFAGLFVLAAVVAAVLAGAAMAKEGGVELSSTPAGTKPGDPWTPTLTLVGGSAEQLAQAQPGVAIRAADTGERLEFPAKPTGDPQQFAARVVFPHEGWWIVEAYDGATGRSYTVGGGQYFIAAPDSEAPTAGIAGRKTSEGGSFPIWPAAAGGSALFLAAVGAALFFRRQRLGLSH